jgi:hypothetical protein
MFVVHSSGSWTIYSTVFIIINSRDQECENASMGLALGLSHIVYCTQTTDMRFEQHLSSSRSSS